MFEVGQNVYWNVQHASGTGKIIDIREEGPNKIHKDWRICVYMPDERDIAWFEESELEAQ